MPVLGTDHGVIVGPTMMLQPWTIRILILWVHPSRTVDSNETIRSIKLNSMSKQHVSASLISRLGWVTEQNRTESKIIQYVDDKQNGIE